MSEETLAKFDDARRDLRSAAGELQQLADAFILIGNPLVADRLEQIAEKVQDGERVCNQTVNEMVNDRFHAAREASNNILLTALALTNPTDRP